MLWKLCINNNVSDSVKAATEEKADTVIIKTDTDGKPVDETKVTIPTASANEIANAGLNLSIKTADGSNVTVAPEALSSIAKQASGSSIEIIVTPEDKAAAEQGISAGMVSGFVVCVGWKLMGKPLGLGATVPGAVACAIALVAVSLATCRKHPTEYLVVEKRK